MPEISPSSFRRELALPALAGIAAIGMFVYLLQERGILLFLLAVAFGALGLLCIIRPPIGVVGVVVCAAFVRVSVATGADTDSRLVASLVVACGLVAAWLVHNLLNRKPLVLLPRSVSLPGVLLIGFVSFSLLWGRLTLDPRVIYPSNFIRVQIAAGMLVIISVALLFVGSDLLRSRELRTVVMAVIVTVGFISLPFRVLEHSLPLVNSKGIFGVWFVAICWAYALTTSVLSVPTRLLLGAGALGWLAMAMSVERDWVSGWLPPLVALIGVTLAIRPRLGVVLLLFGIVLGAAYYSAFYNVLVTQQEQQGSLGGEFGRLELWRRNLSAISGHITFGTGPAGYALYYVTFFPNQAMSTHSNFVDTLAQFGLGGLLSFGALLAGLWRLAWQAFGRLTDGVDRAACAAVVGGLPAVAFSLWLGDWLIPFVYNQTIAGFDHSVYSWLMLALGCGLWAEHASEKPETADAS